MIIFYFSIIILLLFYSHYNRKHFGYMNNLLKDVPPSNNIFDYNLDSSSSILIGTAKDKNSRVASLKFIPWHKPQNVYIANNLHVSELYRNRGIAKNLVMICGKELVQKGCSGIFSTNYEIDDLPKLHTVYWEKLRVNNSGSEIIAPSLQIDFTHYPTHDWLNVQKTKVADYVSYLKKQGLTILNFNSVVVGVESVVDMDGDNVSFVKWHWGVIDDLYESIASYMNSTYIAVPSIKKPNITWDMSVSYFYSKRLFDIPATNMRDIEGWFLDR